MEWQDGARNTTADVYTNAAAITVTAAGLVLVTGNAYNLSTGEFLCVQANVKMLKGGITGNLNLSIQRFNVTGTWDNPGPIGGNFYDAKINVAHFFNCFCVYRCLATGSLTPRITGTSSGQDSTMAIGDAWMTVYRYKLG